MKKIFIVYFILIFSFISAQMTIKVVDVSNGKPITGATIECSGEVLGLTDGNGVLEFKTKCRSVKISAEGFYTESAFVSRSMNIELSAKEERLQGIETVILEDKSDPAALRILDKANEKYAENSPKSLEAYSYKSYEKISMDIDEDSLEYYNQSLKKSLEIFEQIPFSKPKKEIDSTLTVKEVFADSKLFLWERAQEFLYSQKFGEKVNVLDNRVSGLKNPIYELVAIQSNRSTIPRELKLENRELYRYYLTDSIDIEGRETYVIKFREIGSKVRKAADRFNGYLFIDKATYGLAKIVNKRKTETDGSITSNWKLIDGKWFLYSENIKMKISGFSNQNEENDARNQKNKKEDKKENSSDSFLTYGYVFSQYFDFKTNPELEKKQFKGYTYSVQNTDGSLMDQYRTEQLTDREQNTYETIDNIADNYNFEKSAKFLTSLIRGKIKLGKVDFDLGKLIKYNLYEGIRLGAGFKTNQDFHRYISPDAYLAYGFKDHGWKYGVGLDFKTTLQKTSFFRLEYYNDVEAAGRFSENYWNFPMKIMNGGIALNNDRFYHFIGGKISYENDLSNTLSVNISAKKQKEEARFNYDYRGTGNEFDNFSVGLSMHYAPFTKNVMTPAGKFTTQKKLPEFYFNIEQGLEALGGDFTFTKLDAMVNHQFKTKLGTTGVRVYGGMMFGDVPIWHHFTMNGLSGSGNFKFNLFSYLGFATMKGGKYFNDQFVGQYFTHRIPWYFKSIGKNTSSFNVIHRSIIGNMKNPEYHNFDFEKLDHLYQEVGLEWNNFLSSRFNLGFFYRVGHYNTSKFSDNFAIQFKLKLLGF